MRRLIAILTGAMLLAAPAGADDDVDALLKQLGFSADDTTLLLAGRFVQKEVPSTSDRELAAGMAFFAKVPPAELLPDVREGLLNKVDPDTLAYGSFTGAGSLEDLKSLSLAPDAEAQTKLWRDAKPGEDLNLSTPEIAAFQSLEQAGDASVAAVESQIRTLLLGRLHAYRAKGLAGIEPYERDGGKQTPVAGDLERASHALERVKSRIPGFYAMLTGYPADKPAGLEEFFDWSHYEAHGSPVFILTHRAFAPQGDIYAVVQRQYYVSGSYNVMQAVAGFFPYRHGTMVIYVNRTSTDQVEGFGGSAKRSIGVKLMEKQLKELFTKLRLDAKIAP